MFVKLLRREMSKGENGGRAFKNTQCQAIRLGIGIQVLPESSLRLSEQALHNLAAIDDFDRAVAGRHQFFVGDDPQLIVHGVGQILRD